MYLLKDKDSWQLWKENCTYRGDEVSDPIEFPSFVNMTPLNWQMQYERATYYYRSNLEEIIAEMASS